MSLILLSCNIVTTPTQPQLNSTKVGCDMKMTLHHHHHPPTGNSTSAISQLLPTRFLPNFQGGFLGSTTTITANNNSNNINKKQKQQQQYLSYYLFGQIFMLGFRINNNNNNNNIDNSNNKNQGENFSSSWPSSWKWSMKWSKFDELFHPSNLMWNTNLKYGFFSSMNSKKLFFLRRSTEKF